MDTITLTRSDYDQMVELKRLGDELACRLEQFVEEGTLDNHYRYHSLFQMTNELLETKIQCDELINKFDILSQVVNSVAKGDFSKRVEIPGTNTMFANLGLLLNMLAEELEEKVVKKHYVYEAIELIDDAVIMTNNQDVIIFANSRAGLMLNRPIHDMLQLKVANIFVHRKHYEEESGLWINRPDLGLVQPYNKGPVEVCTSRKELRDSYGEKDGMLYILKNTDSHC